MQYKLPSRRVPLPPPPTAAVPFPRRGRLVIFDTKQGRQRPPLSLSKKPRRVWRRRPPNRIKIIFCRGVYLTENTSQAAESSAAALCRAQPPQAALSASQYEFVCRRRANYARSRLQKLVGKARKGFSDSLRGGKGRPCFVFGNGFPHYMTARTSSRAKIPISTARKTRPTMAPFFRAL